MAVEVHGRTFAYVDPVPHIGHLEVARYGLVDDGRLNLNRKRCGGWSCRSHVRGGGWLLRLRCRRFRLEMWWDPGICTRQGLGRPSLLVHLSAHFLVQLSTHLFVNLSAHLFVAALRLLLRVVVDRLDLGGVE